MGAKIIPEFCEHPSYEDWLDCREGLFMGLSMSGVDSRLVDVSLKDFLLGAKPKDCRRANRRSIPSPCACCRPPRPRPRSSIRTDRSGASDRQVRPSRRRRAAGTRNFMLTRKLLSDSFLGTRCGRRGTDDRAGRPKASASHRTASSTTEMNSAFTHHVGINRLARARRARAEARRRRIGEAEGDAQSAPGRPARRRRKFASGG